MAIREDEIVEELDNGKDASYAFFMYVDRSIQLFYAGNASALVPNSGTTRMTVLILYFSLVLKICISCLIMLLLLGILVFRNGI